MNNIKRSNSAKGPLIIGIVLILFGALLIVLNLLDVLKSQNWVDVSATISNIESVLSSGSTTHNVYVDYIFNNVEFKNRLLDTYDISMQVGKVINIRCNPNNPSEFIYASTSLLYILLIVGACSIVGGIAIIVVYFKTIKKYKEMNNPVKDSSLNLNNNFDTNKDNEYLH